MRNTFAAVLLASLAFAQQGTGQDKAAESKKPQQSSSAKLTELLEGNVRAEWEAFKNKDKKAYSDLLADDFVAIEDDGDGQRKKAAVVNEVDHSVVVRYYLNAFHVTSLGPNAAEPTAAFVTYELTMEFPLKAQARFKRVLICELWRKQDGVWKAHYYQETRVK
jgi:hypothetical protein